MNDIIGGGIKSIVFSIVVVSICCFQGYYTHTRREGHGARGVGFFYNISCCDLMRARPYFRLYINLIFTLIKMISREIWIIL